MALDFAKLIELNQRIDGETTNLFMQFMLKAIASPNTNEYVKRSLQLVLEQPEVQVVEPGQGPKK